MFLKPTQKKVVLYFFLVSNQKQELEFTFTYM